MYRYLYKKKNYGTAAACDTPGLSVPPFHTQFKSDKNPSTPPNPSHLKGVVRYGETPRKNTRYVILRTQLTRLTNDAETCHLSRFFIFKLILDGFSKACFFQGWAIALFGKERIALFFAKKSEKKERKSDSLFLRSFALFEKSKRAIRSFALFLKRAKEPFALLGSF